MQAKHCFARASLPREVAIADAYYLREQARATPLGAGPAAVARSRAFLAAAEAFLICAEDAKKEKRAYFRNAAGCFERGGDNGRAASAYVCAEEYTAAAKLYRDLGQFDEAVRVIKTYKQNMDADVVQDIVDHSRLFYFRGQELR